MASAPMLAVALCLLLAGCAHQSGPGDAGSPGDDATSPAQDLEGRVLASHDTMEGTGADGPRLKVRLLADAEAYRQAWATTWEGRHGGQQAPAVDFAREVVLEARYEGAPSTGYAVALRDASWDGQAYRFALEVQQPGSGCAVGGAISVAYLLAAVPRMQGWDGAGPAVQETHVDVPCS